jgi:hypothetical protein
VNYIRSVLSPPSGFDTIMTRAFLVQNAQHVGIYQVCMPIAFERREDGIHPITNKWPKDEIGLLDFNFNSKPLYTNGHDMAIQMCNTIV